MKIKQSWTIDEELVNWLGEDNNKNKSEVVNEILWGAFNTRNDPYKKLNTITEKRIRLEAEEEQQLKVLAEIVREGDLKAREEAQTIIKARKEEREFEEKKLQEQYDNLVSAGFWDELNNCKSHNEVDKIGVKVRDARIDINFSRLLIIKSKFGIPLGEKRGV